MTKINLKFMKNKRIRIAIIFGLIAVAIGGAVYYRNSQVMPQAAVHFLTDVKLPSSGQKVLIFTPHADDETIAAGGYIYESTQRKADVKVVMVTDSNKYHQKARRYVEFQKTTKILGVPSKNLSYLNYPDGHLDKVNQKELYQKLKKIIDQDHPDFIISSSPLEDHKDHATLGKVVAEIVKNENRPNLILYQYLIHSDRYPQPKKMRPDEFLTPPIRFVNFDKQWQRLILNEHIEDIKTEAVYTYKSQLEIPFLRNILLGMIRRNELFSTQ